jgi:hypothetical protein
MKNPILSKKVFKAYTKARDEADRTKAKVKFSVNAYIETLESESGKVASHKGVMMWEKQYQEFAESITVHIEMLQPKPPTYDRARGLVPWAPVCIHS